MVRVKSPTSLNTTKKTEKIQKIMTNSRTFQQVIDGAPKKKTKKIEFLIWINTDDKKFVPTGVLSPEEFDNVVLISMGQYVGTGHDIMLAYDKDPMEGFLYLGNWNDGTV